MAGKKSKATKDELPFYQHVNDALQQWMDEGAPMPPYPDKEPLGDLAPKPNSSMIQPERKEINSMAKFFYAPDGADKKEKIPYPAKPLGQDQIFDAESLRCMVYVAHRTGVPIRDIMSHLVTDWYDVWGCCISTADLKRSIAISKKKDAA